jgi:hypothetical protein
MQLPTFEVNSDAQALTILDRKHKIIINLGGKGSGKTATHPAWALDRGTWDTGQLHGIFTNTEKQLKDGVLLEMKKRLPLAGVECDHGRRPPKAWIQRWARENIPIPAIVDYRGIFYTSQGLHALCGTLFNQSFRQYETLEFASLRIEEIPALSRTALTTMLTRLRCGEGEDCDVRLGHRHQAWLFGNPPVGPHPWLFDWLDTYEEGAKRLYHDVKDDETCNGCDFVTPFGRKVPRAHGPQLNHRQWPLLRRGIGSIILIKSKTSDNRKNLSAGYEDDLAMNFDKATADAWLAGELVREMVGGCYSASFSDVNVRDVRYDPNRTLFVCVDINIEPRVAVLMHALDKGEYPEQWHQPGVEQLGAFGEFFHLGGMSDEMFAEAMARGDRGSGDAGYPDEELRGLPGNWNGLAAHKGRVVLYGDGAGNIKSVHSRNCESSWTIIKQTLKKLGLEGRFSVSVPSGQNPPARARIHSVCAKLTSATGAHSLSIAPRCRHTLKDCEQVVWNEEGLAEREWRQGPEKMRTHCMAAVGYCVVQRSPYGREIGERNEIPIGKLPPRTKAPSFFR